LDGILSSHVGVSYLLGFVEIAKQTSGIAAISSQRLPGNGCFSLTNLLGKDRLIAGLACLKHLL
jgi:hypothetical protein